MRPSVLLLALACALAVLTVAVLAVPAVPVEIVAGAWLLLGAAVIADWAVSPGARHFAMEIDAPAEIFAGEEGVVALRLKGMEGTRAGAPT
ncbi:MAG: hypothetical protein ABGW90_11765, partial [Martelella sp.]